MQAKRRRDHPVAATFYGLILVGYDEVRAGNLTALSFGLRAVDGGWTVAEITALLFLKHRVGTRPSSRS